MELAIRKIISKKLTKNLCHEEVTFTSSHSHPPTPPRLGVCPANRGALLDTVAMNFF